jgi:hypothetical protein
VWLRYARHRARRARIADYRRCWPPAITGCPHMDPKRSFRAAQHASRGRMTAFEGLFDERGQRVVIGVAQTRQGCGRRPPSTWHQHRALAGSGRQLESAIPGSRPQSGLASYQERDFQCRRQAPQRHPRDGNCQQRPDPGYKKWREMAGKSASLLARSKVQVSEDWMVGAPGLEPGTR